MREPVSQLKRAAMFTCHSRKFSFTEFMEDWGLEDILVEADQSEVGAAEIAARVLNDCCVSGGKFNDFHVDLLTVLRYLNDVFGTSSHQEQSVRDLLSILNDGGGMGPIMGWMRTHYPTA